MQHDWVFDDDEYRSTCSNCGTIFVGFGKDPTDVVATLYETSASGELIFQPCSPYHPNVFTHNFFDCDVMSAFHIQRQ